MRVQRSSPSVPRRRAPAVFAAVVLGVFIVGPRLCGLDRASGRVGRAAPAVGAGDGRLRDDRGRRSGGSDRAPRRSRPRHLGRARPHRRPGVEGRRDPALDRTAARRCEDRRRVGGRRGIHRRPPSPSRRRRSRTRRPPHARWGHRRGADRGRAARGRRCGDAAADGRRPYRRDRPRASPRAVSTAVSSTSAALDRAATAAEALERATTLVPRMLGADADAPPSCSSRTTPSGDPSAGWSGPWPRWMPMPGASPSSLRRRAPMSPPSSTTRSCLCPTMCAASSTRVRPGTCRTPPRFPISPSVPLSPVRCGAARTAKRSMRSSRWTR